MRSSGPLLLSLLFAGSAAACDRDDACNCNPHGGLTLVLDIPIEGDVEYYGEVSVGDDDPRYIDCRAAALSAGDEYWKERCRDRRLAIGGSSYGTVTASIAVMGSPLRCDGTYEQRPTSTFPGPCCERTTTEAHLQFSAP